MLSILIVIVTSTAVASASNVSILWYCDQPFLDYTPAKGCLEPTPCYTTYYHLPESPPRLQCNVIGAMCIIARLGLALPYYFAVCLMTPWTILHLVAITVHSIIHPTVDWEQMVQQAIGRSIGWVIVDPCVTLGLCNASLA